MSLYVTCDRWCACCGDCLRCYGEYHGSVYCDWCRTSMDDGGHGCREDDE